MFRTSALIATAALIAMTHCASASVITTSAIAPTVDGGDIANLGAPVANAGSVWSDRPVQGQSFTTGSSASTLNAITFQLNEGGNAPINGWKDYQMRVGTITGADPDQQIDPIYVGVTRHNDDEPNDTFFTYTFDTPLNLAANTVYVFDVGIEASQAGWQAGIPGIRRTNDDYAGGQRWQGALPNQIDNTTGDDFNIDDTSNDLVFHLDIVDVPEPGSLALLGLGGLLIGARRRRG